MPAVSFSTPPTVLVTGASRGLGRGVALCLAEAGCSVAVHFVQNQAAAEQTAEDCQKLAPDARQVFPVIGGDVGRAADRHRIFTETLAALGRIDALVNNAGITSPGRKDVTQADEAGFDLVMAVNLKGPHFLTQLCANHWLAHPGDSILPGGYKLAFVSSVSATLASINRGDYCMSKAALAMCAQIWALRLGQAGIQVMEFRPGIMETDMTAAVKEKYDPYIATNVPLRRWGQAEDVGLAVRSFLLGNFPFSTGAVVTLDGGLCLPRL